MLTREDLEWIWRMMMVAELNPITWWVTTEEVK